MYKRRSGPSDRFALDTIDNNISRTLELSHRIIELGEQGEWDKVQALDDERLKLLQSVFTDQAFEPRRGEFRDRLETLLSLNEEAVALCAKARRDSMANSRAAKRGAQAITAYRKQTGNG